MGRQNIYKTLNVASAMTTSNLEDLVGFLVTNRQYLYTSDKKSEAFRARFSGHSLLSELVHRLTILGKDQAYSLIRIPSKTVSLREAIDMTFVPIDLLQIKEMIPSCTKTLSLFPELDDKLVINVTDITKVNGDFSDVTQFHYRVVRDFLSRSFYSSGKEVWISPTLVRYVAKVYSMTIGGRIARLYNLGYDAQMLIQMVFCTFFVGRMSSPEVAPAFMKAHARGMGLPGSIEIHQILSFIQDTLHKPVPDTLEDVCQVIDALENGLLKSATGSRISRPTLNMMLATIGPDTQTSTIALEYPPYFLFLMMMVIANQKVGLSYSMKNLNLITEGRDEMEKLIHSSTFLDAI